MDLRNLENLLCQCVDPSDPEHVRAKEVLVKHAQEVGWDHVEALMYHDLSKKVQEELESLSFYQDYKGCFVNQENGAYGFHPSIVAPDLVHISFKRSVEAAVTYFRKMVSLPYADKINRTPILSNCYNLLLFKYYLRFNKMGVQVVSNVRGGAGNKKDSHL